MNDILNLIIPSDLTVLPEIVVLVRCVIVFSCLELVTASFALLGAFKR